MSHDVKRNGEVWRPTSFNTVSVFQVHKWVNVESMLEKCFVGKLVGDDKTSKGASDFCLTQVICNQYSLLFAACSKLHRTFSMSNELGQKRVREVRH